MINVAAACTALVARIKAAGFDSVSVDPEELNPSCVWVQPRGITDVRLNGDATLEVWLYAIVPNVDTLHAMTLLDDALAGLLSLDLPFADVATPVDLAAAVLLPNNSAALPAYRLAVDLELSEETS